MPAGNRFELIAPLPSPRRHLHVAVDRGSRPPRAVVLAFYPRVLADDPGRLGRLAGEMERAALLFHPNVLAPVGIEAVGDDLAAVTVWRDAVTLRDVLDAGGRLPVEIAARIAADVCAGLAHAHGRPEPVVHGLLRPEAVLLDGSGIAAVSGFGMPGGSGIPDDLLGVAELLHESLAGEPPEGPSVPLETAGVPEALAAVVNRARGSEPEARQPTAELLRAAIAEAVALAPHATVAAYLEAIVPAGTGVRAERRRKIEAALGATTSAVPEEISEHDIVGVATPPPAAGPLPPPGAAPLPPATAAPLPPATATATPLPPSPATSAALPTPLAATPVAAAPAAARPERGTGRGVRVPLGVALSLAVACVAIGFALAPLVRVERAAEERSGPVPEARAPAPVAPTGPTPAAAAPTRPPARRSAASAAEKRREKGRESVRRVEARAVEKERGTGFVDVTAPEGAEVWLDGRRIGTGSTRREIPEGDHRVEVRYKGAKVAERFHVAPRETWTYAVTPK